MNKTIRFETLTLFFYLADQLFSKTYQTPFYFKYPIYFIIRPTNKKRFATQLLFVKNSYGSHYSALNYKRFKALTWIGASQKYFIRTISFCILKIRRHAIGFPT